MAAGHPPRLAIAPEPGAPTIPALMPSYVARWLSQPAFLRGSTRAIPLFAACGLALVFRMFARHTASSVETLTVITWHGNLIETQVLDFGNDDLRIPLYGLKPDGMMLAFSTNRWSPAGNEGCDIAVRDVASKAIWRVTEGPDCDEMPVWSSARDGLAFLRHYRERGDSVAICSVAKASEALHCTPINRALFVADVVGWRADRDVVIATSHDSS